MRTNYSKHMTKSVDLLGLWMLFIVLGPSLALAQNNTVSGTVTNARTDEPITDVNIIVRGMNIGTSTNVDGHYSLKVPSLQDTLVFSFVGYKSEVVPIRGKTEINIQLQPMNIVAEELVVVGYATKKKKNLTGAVATVEASEMEKVSVTNPTQMLQGKVTGVNIKQTSGAPGSELQVTIRGVGSLGASSKPLYVVDGFPIGTSIGVNINPSNIKSITVLKDAASTAIYGARGANGVVLITTKSAQPGETNLKVSIKYGIQTVPESRKTDVLNGEEFARFKKEIFIDQIQFYENRTPSINEIPKDFRYPEKTKYSTNWLNEILDKNAPYKKINVSFSDGTGGIHSFISAGYTNEQGTLIGTSYKNYSVRANFEG